MAEYEFVPGSRPAGPDCTDRAAYGTASNLDQYIAKQYQLRLCGEWIHNSRVRVWH